MGTYAYHPPGTPSGRPSPRSERALLRSHDHWHINVTEPWEIRFWTREFDCDEATLRRAVDQAGSVAGAVRFYLATH